MWFIIFPYFTSCAQDAEEKEEDDEEKKDEEDEEKKDEEEEEPEEPDEPVRSLYHFHQAIFIFFSILSTPGCRSTPDCGSCRQLAVDSHVDW